MKKIIKLSFIFMLFFANIQYQFSQNDDKVTLEDVSETLIENSIDSTVFNQTKERLDNIENNLELLKENFSKVDDPINSKEDFDYLLSFILAFVTSMLAKIQKRGWLKNVDETIVVVIITSIVIIAGLTVLKGDYNPLTFLLDWFVNSGGAVLAYELVLKRLFGRTSATSTNA